MFVPEVERVVKTSNRDALIPAMCTQVVRFKEYRRHAIDRNAGIPHEKAIGGAC